MAGLLDFEDPNTVGAMKLGLGLLSAGGPSRMPVSLGQAIGTAGNDSMDAMKAARQEQVMSQMRNLQMQELLRKTKQAQMAEEAKQKILNDPNTDPRLRQYVQMGGDISKLFDPTAMAEGAKMTIPGLGMMGGNPVIAEGTPKRVPPMFKEKYVNGPKGEPYVQKEISLDNGVTWQDEGVASPRFAKQVGPTIINAPAPTIAEVVDPTNPKQLLKIDAKTYRGGGIGSPGVVGIAGKEPTFAKREEKEGQGKEMLSQELDNMRQHYITLKDLGGMPSSEQSGLSNASSWAQSSALGQLGGRVLGTKEQDERNAIKATRLRLMNAIKNATGMSAQQMNSNVELKTWLDSLGDPTQSFESNMEIIKSIEDAFLSDKKPSGQKQPKDIQAAAAAELARRRGGR